MRNIEGRNPVREALRAKKKIKKIYVKEGIKKDERITEILKKAKKKNIEIIEKEDFEKVSKTDRHQGIIAVVPEDKSLSVEDIVEQAYNENRKPLILILSDVRYEHNLGNILRSSESFGVDAVVLHKNSIGVTPHVVKSSAGASEHIPTIQTNIYSVVKKLKRLGLKIIGLEEGKNKTVYGTNLNVPLAIILGAEDTGINESLKKNIDEFVSIPMKGKIESLNLAIATSIMLYEVSRQKIS